MLVGVKYCGGCNPRYDRKGFLKQLMDCLGEKHTFETVQLGKVYDVLLVLGGCHNCCATYEDIQTKCDPICVRDQKDYEKILQWMKEKFHSNNK